MKLFTDEQIRANERHRKKFASKADFGSTILYA